MTEVSPTATIRAVVVAARGPHFSVGLDLKAMAGLLTGGGDAGTGRSGPRGTARRPWPCGPWPPGPGSNGCSESIYAGGGLPEAGDRRHPRLLHRRRRRSGQRLRHSSGQRRRRLLGARDQGGDRGRSREPAAAPPHHRQGPRGRAGLHGQGHHRRPGQGDRSGERGVPRRRRRRRRGPGHGGGDRRQLASGRRRNEGGSHRR